MRMLISAVAVSTVLLIATSEANAQAWVVESPLAPAAPVVYGGTYSSFYVPPYSYYTAIPFPARGYVGYGYNDFPFYGQPYGSRSDPWTWGYMSGAYARGLARYYYPPVQ